MKIICVGRNYAEHARELKNEVPSEPVFFMKPDTAVLQQGRAFYIPSFSKDVHFEGELVLRICKEGKQIAGEFAARYYDAVTVGIDFTARDVQQRQKEKGLPWEPAKAFDGSAAVGEWVALHDAAAAAPIRFSLKRNGETVQESSSEEMIFAFSTILSFVSRYVTLRKGDLVFTGTPAGVGPVAAGDVFTGYLGGRQVLTTSIR